MPKTPASLKISLEAYGCALLIACGLWAVVLQLFFAGLLPDPASLIYLASFPVICALTFFFFAISIAPTFLLTAAAVHALAGRSAPMRPIGALALVALAAVASVHLFDHGASDWVDAADPVTGARHGPTPTWYLVGFTAQASVLVVACLLRKPIERRAERFARQDARARRRDTLPVRGRV
ncbi:MAG: hypothetical protein WAP03_17025 [Methylorubrum rhodinum]|uniref:hypothetical protein n=1 Tax=Methylorubrum rhodinum TaxID=29428 RepID=UPI003BB0C5AE